MRTVVLAATVLLLAAAAGAAPIVQVHNVAGIPNFQRTLKINSFDTNLGTLESVSLLLEVELTGGQVVLDNESNLPASATVNLGAEVTVTASEVFFPVTQAQASRYVEVALTGDDGDGPSIDPAGEDGVLISLAGAYGNYMTLINHTDGPSAMAQLDSFANTSAGEDFEIALDSATLLSIAGSGGVAGSFTPASIHGSLTVTYAYGPAVPEPATATLLALGTLVLLRRNKRQAM